MKPDQVKSKRSVTDEDETGRRVRPRNKYGEREAAVTKSRDKQTNLEEEQNTQSLAKKSGKGGKPQRAKQPIKAEILMVE